MTYKILYLSVLLLSFQSLKAQDSNCYRTTQFGEAKICLPTIDGYQECYEDPDIKVLADATEIPMNTILGYYLNNKAYAEMDSTGLQGLSDYFKIYATLELKDYTADQALLDNMKEVVSNSFNGNTWDMVKDEIDKLDFEMELGAPTLVKTYKLNDNSFTCVLLIKYEIPDSEAITVAFTINGMLLNERLVWMAYYMEYENEETLNVLQINSNKNLEKLLSAN